MSTVIGIDFGNHTSGAEGVCGGRRVVLMPPGEVVAIVCDHGELTCSLDKPDYLPELPGNKHLPLCKSMFARELPVLDAASGEVINEAHAVDPGVLAYLTDLGIRVTAAADDGARASGTGSTAHALEGTVANHAGAAASARRTVDFAASSIS